MRRLAAKRLLPGPGDHIEPIPGQVHGEGGRCRVADYQALATPQPRTVGKAHAGGGAVPGEHDVMRRVDRVEVGQAAVAGVQGADIRQVQMLRDVGGPQRGEAFECQHVYRAGPEQGPHRHLHRASVGGGDDAELPPRRNAEQRCGPLGHLNQFGFGHRRTMAAAQQMSVEGGDTPARAFCAWSGREASI